MNLPIGVCIPTYNGAKYLRECLDSVLSQTFPDFEILIVDDRSSDETVNIAKEYADRDRRIRLIVNEQNLGLVGNWNSCIELAQGEWIKFVFQDDLIEPTCLEKMFAASKPEIPISFCRRQFIFEDSTPDEVRSYHLSVLSLLDKFFPLLTEIPASHYSKALLSLIGTMGIDINFIGEPVAVMFHRSVLYRFGNFNANLIHACDFEFWTRIASNTGIIYVPETLATFRLHGQSTTATNQNSRHYRKSTLDPLIILHDFALAPIYATLRAVASSHEIINLIDFLEHKAYSARRIAERATVDPDNPNSSFLAEWEYICQLYPILSVISKRNLLKRIVIHGTYRWRQLRRQVKALSKSHQ